MEKLFIEKEVCAKLVNHGQFQPRCYLAYL